MKTASSSFLEFLRRFGVSTQGRVFLASIAYGLMLALFMLWWGWHSDEGAKMAGMFGAFMATGAAGGVIFGAQQAVPGYVIFITTFSLEMVVMLFFYPLATFSSEELARLPRIRKRVESSLKTAERFRQPLQRWGGVGIVFFIVVPFYLTGPLVGALIGRLIGYSHLLSISLSAIGTAAMVVLWMWGANWLVELLGPYSWILPVGIIVIIVGLLAFYLIRRHRRRIIERRSQEPF